MDNVARAAGMAQRSDKRTWRIVPSILCSSDVRSRREKGGTLMMLKGRREATVEWVVSSGLEFPEGSDR